MNYALVFWAELHISSGLAAVLNATIPLFGLAARSPDAGGGADDVA